MSGPRLLHGKNAMRSAVAPDLENDLNAALVSFATSTAMLRDLRDGGHVLPAEAARIIAPLQGPVMSALRINQIVPASEIGARA
jgi:hypothetical protein